MYVHVILIPEVTFARKCCPGYPNYVKNKSAVNSYRKQRTFAANMV